MVVLASILALASCRTNPEVAKKRYLESGNRYFDKAKYKEARIMYKDALQKDNRLGPAWYHLGLTALKLSSHAEAVSALRRAIELLPQDQPDRWDAVAKLADLFLQFGRDQKGLMDEVATFSSDLLKHDRNSYDGHRLTADLDFYRAIESAKGGKKAEGLQYLKNAIKEYGKADQIKPNQPGFGCSSPRTCREAGHRGQRKGCTRKCSHRTRLRSPPIRNCTGCTFREEIRSWPRRC